MSCIFTGVFLNSMWYLYICSIFDVLMFCLYWSQSSFKMPTDYVHKLSQEMKVISGLIVWQVILVSCRLPLGLLSTRLEVISPSQLYDITSQYQSILLLLGDNLVTAAQSYTSLQLQWRLCSIRKWPSKGFVHGKIFVHLWCKNWLKGS